MPGIAGLITTRPRSWAEPRLMKMLECLHHEAFYTTGTHIDEAQGVYVGWTAIKGSFAAGMPLRNERGNVSLIFSGEEYRDQKAIAELKGPGHPLSTNPSSYLVHLYEEDANFPACLNGLFHGLVIDSPRGTATLFNDRYGMNRLYYHESSSAFYFAVEAKAILAVCPEMRTPSPQGLGEFVALSCVLEDRTIFKNIFVMPAGSAWVFRNGIREKRTYFRPSEWERQPPLAANSFYDQLCESFRGALPKYFAGQEHVGVALTGGLDTRAIMAWHKAAPQSLPCYTFGGMFRECHDVVLARKVANLCRQQHHVIKVGQDFLERFPHYAERSMYMTEGCVDVYRASDLYVSEKARQIAPAKVVGTYGSEIIRHAVMFKPMLPADSLFCPEFLSHVGQASATYNLARHTHPVEFAAFRQSPWYHHGVLALEQSQLTVRSPYLDNDFVQTVFRAPLSTNGNGNGNLLGDLRLRLIKDGNAELAAIPSDRGIAAVPRPLSVLQHNLLEFTFKAEYAYDYGMPQWVARADHWFAPLHLERLFLGRHKFLHYRVWYRDQLANYVREILLDSRTLSRPYLQKATVETIVDGHLKGGQNHTSTIHKLLSLELLHRLFFD